jgi:hypothetical protein
MGYQLIETVTVGSGGAASIEFTGIPQDGVSLQVLLSSRDSYASLLATTRFILNNDTTANYSFKALIGDGSAASSSNASGASDGIWASSSPAATSTANTFGSSSIYISNYTSSAAKSISSEQVSENNGTTSFQRLVAATYAGTSAITQIKINSPATFVEHSAASLYKITAD